MANPKYYSAAEGTYIEVSDAFLAELRALSNNPLRRGAISAAIGWINTAGARDLPLKAIAFQGLMTEYLDVDFVSAQSMAALISLTLVDYDLFKTTWRGVPMTTELSDFFEAAEAGVGQSLSWRDSLFFRQNANRLLKKREDAKLLGGQSGDLRLQLKSFAPIFGMAV